MTREAAQTETGVFDPVRGPERLVARPEVLSCCQTRNVDHRRHHARFDRVGGGAAGPGGRRRGRPDELRPRPAPHRARGEKPPGTRRCARAGRQRARRPRGGCREPRSSISAGAGSTACSTRSRSHPRTGSADASSRPRTRARSPRSRRARSRSRRWRLRSPTCIPRWARASSGWTGRTGNPGIRGARRDVGSAGAARLGRRRRRPRGGRNPVPAVGPGARSAARSCTSTVASTRWGANVEMRRAVERSANGNGRVLVDGAVPAAID